MQARMHVHGEHVGYTATARNRCVTRPQSGNSRGPVALAQRRSRGAAEPPPQRRGGVVSQTVFLRGDQQEFISTVASLPAPWRWCDRRAARRRANGFSAAIGGSRHHPVLAGHPWLRESLQASSCSAGDGGCAAEAALFRAWLVRWCHAGGARVEAIGRQACDLYAGIGMLGSPLGLRKCRVGRGVSDASRRDLVAKHSRTAGDCGRWRRRRNSCAGAVCWQPPVSSSIAGTGLSPSSRRRSGSPAPRRVGKSPATPNVARDLQLLTAAGLRVDDHRLRPVPGDATRACYVKAMMPVSLSRKP